MPHKKINSILGSEKTYLLIFTLFILNLLIGFMYLTSLIEKVKLTDYNNQLIRQNNQLKSDISRVKMEIDEKVDLHNIEKVSREKLEMVDIDEVKYIKVE